jgi:hypothetical protein
VHALLLCQDHQLRKHFPFFEDFSAAQPFLLQQVNNQLVHDFLSQQNTRLFLFLSELICGWPRPVSSRSANNLAEGHPPL